MAQTISDFASLLTGLVPHMSYPLAVRTVQSAWREIRDSRKWSFLVGSGYLQCPGELTIGTATTTLGLTTVAMDATASAAINAFGSNPPITACQFRISSNRIYNIIAWSGGSPGSLTLDIPYQEPSQNAIPYQIYRCYYGPPPTSIQSDGTYDFLRWMSLYDFTNQLPLGLGKQKTELDMLDPARTNLGSPSYYLVSYQGAQTNLPLYPMGTPLYELYPHPLSLTAYGCMYERRGVDLTSTQPLPPQISVECLEQAAIYHAYRWAEANKGRFPELQKSNFMALMKEARGEFALRLSKLQAQDEESFVQRVIPPSLSYPIPLTDAWLSGSYLQGHDPFGPV